GKPLSGVTIYSKTTAKGAVTGNDGEFTIPSAAADTLTFSFIGYDTQKVGVGGRSNLVIKLIPNNEQLSEVVVIGYGQQRKGDLTSSVATVTSENFVKAPVQDAGQLLQGKVAGLTVGTTSGNPTGGSQILLRGNTTLFGANKIGRAHV